MTARIRTHMGLSDIVAAGIGPATDEAYMPPCYGLGELFDSRDIGDHLIARVFCDDCPITDHCKAEFLAALKRARGLGRHAGPEGTWAGKLYNNASQEVEVPTTRRCLGCGTPMLGRHNTLPSGYVYHDAKGYCATCYRRKERKLR